MPTAFQAQVTASRIADAINRETGASTARVTGADAVTLDLAGSADVFRLIARIENVRVEPDQRPRVVVNGRSGSVVVVGYRFSGDRSVEQENYPTAGSITGGATVETAVQADIFKGPDAGTVLGAPNSYDEFGFPGAANTQRIEYTGQMILYGRQLCHISYALLQWRVFP